jgi:hypothetical protein
VDAVYLADPVPATHDPNAKTNPKDAYSTAFNYLVTFHPRWFTYYQASGGPCNRMLGPDRISPIYKTVVAINDDTLYASAFIGVKKEPVIVTVPATTDIYSVLPLDQYGNVITGIPSGQPGVYGLTGPGWQGTLPNGITQVPVPYNYTSLLFRADKYSPTGQDMRQEAEQFRRNLHAAYLSDYLQDSNSGKTIIVAEEKYSIPFKGIADYLVANQAIAFLKMLQTGVLAGTTQPLTPDEQALSDNFNTLFSDHGQWPQLVAGAQACHVAILADYQAHRFPGTTWITFTNIGEWDQTFQGYLDRSAITEYIQYGNNHNAAVYYQTFVDANGAPLDGSSHAYILRFPKDQQPEVSRFWSLTAYTPEAIELVPNDANKYVVASYTPGLVTAPNGSVTIIMSTGRPSGFPEANWLPIPPGPFNIMLRAYGPKGSVLNNTYTPPAVATISANSH